jgi:hypothetical protein
MCVWNGAICVLIFYIIMPLLSKWPSLQRREVFLNIFLLTICLLICLKATRDELCPIVVV